MNDEIKLLREIYFLLATLVAVYVAVNALRAISFLWGLRKAMRRILEERFQDDAQLMFERDHTEELLQVCKKRLASRPNDRVALWYAARAHYHRGERLEARDLLARLKRIDPGCEESYANGLFAELRKAGFGE